LARRLQSQPAVRVDPLLFLALAAVAGGLVCVEPWPTALALGGSVLVLHRGLRPALAVLALALLALGAWRSRAALDAFNHRHLAARHAIGEPRRCHALARVTSSPTRLGNAMSFVAELTDAECEGRRLPAGTRARLYGGSADVRRGDRLEVTGQLAPVQLFRNPGVPDPRPGAARREAVLSGMLLSAERATRAHGVRSAIDGARNRVRARIDATFAPEAAPLARALVLGETDLDPDDDRAFKLSGLAHLLAVSGTHLVLAVVTLVRLFGALLVRIESLAARFDLGRTTAFFGIFLALGYADFAGGSGSAWRAAWMLAVGFLVRALGRHPSATRALAGSLLVGALYDPLIAFDISFLLSAAATTGLLVLGRPLVALAARIRVRPVRWLAASLATTTAAMIPCAPFLALLAPQIGLVGAFANVVAAPAGELAALPLCLLHAIASPVPMLERGIALAGSGALLFVRAVARTSAAVTLLQAALPAPNAWHFAVGAVALSCLARAATRRTRLLTLLAGALALGLVELATIRAGRPRGELRVTVLDVGQGDSLLIDLPDGRLVLLDGGGFVGSPVDPGRRVILPVLRARRRHRVDLAILSHPHPDHFTCLGSALPELEVGELWDSGQGEAEGAGATYAALIARLRARGVPIRRPSELCAKPRQFGRAEMRLLAPCPGFVPGRGANDNSLVIALGFGRRRALLMGDAEATEEAELVAAHGAELRADFLKVGHHGSRTSSGAALLDAVRPTFSAISCGVRNRFGHPRPETLGALHARGIAILRTDLLGGITWASDGDRMRTASALAGP
jgi:competence protein ComEC